MQCRAGSECPACGHTARGMLAIVAIVAIAAAPGSGTLFSLSQAAEECLCFANCSAEPGRAGVKPGELQPAPRPRLVPAAGMGRRDLSEY